MYCPEAREGASPEAKERSVQVRQDDNYRVETSKAADERYRRLTVSRREGAGPWVLWGSYSIGDHLDADKLEREVLSRLPQPQPEDAKARVLAKLGAHGVGPQRAA